MRGRPTESERPRSSFSSAQAARGTQSNNLIDLENLAGVKELETRLSETTSQLRSKETELRAQSAELREVRRRLNSVEKDYQDQLDKQGRRITEGSGQVAELENSLRDQTRRLADSTKKIFDLEQLLDDAEQKLKGEVRGNRDRENTITFQAKQIQVIDDLI